MPHYRSARIDCLGIGWVVHVITEGELIRLAPADARVVAYEEGLTPADTCVARIVLMKHAPAECYAAPLEAGLGI